MSLAFVVQDYNPFFDYSRSSILHRCVYPSEQLPKEGIDFFSIPDNVYFFQVVEENSILLQKRNYIQLLCELFLLEKRTEFDRFISSNEILIYPLFDAYKQINEMFPTRLNLNLEVIKDPEEDFECLFILIDTDLSIEQSLDFLEQFDYIVSSNWDIEVQKILCVDVVNKLSLVLDS